MGWEVRGFSTHSFTRSHLPTCLLLLLSILFLKRCSSFPNGADIPLESTCRDMRPIHGNARGQPEEPEPSFLIKSLNETFTPDEMITFQVSASSQDNCFIGIYAQVRPENRENPIGGFPPSLNPDFLTPVTCNGRNQSTITQRRAVKLCEVKLTWRAPEQRRDVTSVRLFVTIVQNLSTFWVQLKSLPVTLFRETPTIPTVKEITFLNTSPRASVTSTTVLPSSSIRKDSDRTLRTFSTEAGLYSETPFVYPDYAEARDTDDSSSRSSSGSKSSKPKDSGESTDSTERPEKTEPNLLTTPKYKRTSPSRRTIRPTRPQPQRSSESMRTLETTELSSSTTGRFTDESTPTFLHTLMTLLKTKSNDATPTFQTDYRPHTYEVPITVVSTESLTSSPHMETTTSNIEEPSTAHETMSTSSLTTTFSFLSVSRDTTVSELSTTTVTSKEPLETTYDVQKTTPKSSTSGSTLSIPLSTTEGVLTTTLNQMPITYKKTTANAGLTTLNIRDYSKSNTPVQSSIPSSHETEFVTTEKILTTHTKQFTNLVISRSPEANGTDMPEHKDTSSPARTNTKIVLTEETIPLDNTQTTTSVPTTIGIPKTTYGSVSTILTTLAEEFRSTSEERKPTTHQADTTSFSTETTPVTHSLNIRTILTSPLSSDSVPSTMKSTKPTFPSTIRHTTQHFSATNPRATLTIRPTTARKTVSGSTEVTTEAFSSTSSKHSSIPMTDGTTLMDRTSATSSTQKPISTTHPFTTQTIPTSPLTSNSVPSTMESLTHTFPSTIGHTTQIVPSTNPSTTQTIRPTTARKTVSGSTEVTTEAFSSTSSKHSSIPMTDGTTLMDRTSATSSTQKPISTTHPFTTQTIPTSPLTSNSVPSTMESTTHTFPSTIGHTTQIAPSTNPSTTQTIRPTTARKTVSGSTEVTTEAFSSTSSKHTSEPMTHRTTLIDSTSVTASTQKPISTTHPFTTRTIPTSPLTSDSVPSTMESTTHTFPSTIGHTTQIVPSTNPSTTQTIRPTTARKTVSGSTEVTTPAYSSTSSKHTSEPMTNRTTLMDSTSATSSTQTPTASKPSTRSTTETDSPIVEEYTTDEMETTSEDFTPMDNHTEETVTPTVTPTVSVISSTLASSSTARTTQNLTMTTQNITTVIGEMSSTNRQSTETSSKVSIRSETTKITEERAVSTMQAAETTPTLGGTEIVMVFEIDNYPFNNSLEDTNSEYYKVLNDALATAVENVYSTTENKPNSVGARRFERGSVIAEMSTVYERALSDDEMTDAVLVMFDHVTNDMFDKSFNVSGFWVLDANGNRVNVDHCYGTKCPLGLKCRVSGDQCIQHCEDNPGFCNNDGTCLGYPTSVNISCNCSKGYSGEQCSIMREPQEVGTLAIVLGGVGAVLLVLIVILMVGMVCLLRTKPKPVLPTSVDNLGIPRFPMIPLRVLDNMAMNETDGADSSTTSDHPSIDENGGVIFSRLPDLITSTSSMQDYERDVVSNPSRERRRRNVSFNDIREVLEADDTVSIETFSFGRSYVSREEDNGQTIFRWRLESVSSSTPSRDEAPT
ncbi:putative defense protein 3 [Holothuria leucospilota]|uniref:Defense protein 3 n=1 Tax=Holothuria leucospilota TaxID=206669 RepID=A0A9Q1C0U7_HOLLE|nr:putative defense protein 3 [Holothuria leucospilota]